MVDLCQNIFNDREGINKCGHLSEKWFGILPDTKERRLLSDAKLLFYYYKIWHLISFASLVNLEDLLIICIMDVQEKQC